MECASRRRRNSVPSRRRRTVGPIDAVIVSSPRKAVRRQHSPGQTRLPGTAPRGSATNIPEIRDAMRSQLRFRKVNVRHALACCALSPPSWIAQQTGGIARCRLDHYGWRAVTGTIIRTCPDNGGEGSKPVMVTTTTASDATVELTTMAGGTVLASLTVPGHPEQVVGVRRFVRRMVGDASPMADTAVLL